jgi:rRNA processing protein Gar1
MMMVVKLSANAPQISEGKNSVGIVRWIFGFCLCAVMRSPYFFVFIFNKLETILKINQKYFEKSLQFSKKVVYLYQQLSK